MAGIKYKASLVLCMEAKSSAIQCKVCSQLLWELLLMTESNGENLFPTLCAVSQLLCSRYFIHSNETKPFSYQAGYSPALNGNYLPGIDQLQFHCTKILHYHSFLKCVSVTNMYITLESLSSKISTFSLATVQNLDHFAHLVLLETEKEEESTLVMIHTSLHSWPPTRGQNNVLNGLSKSIV